MILEAAADWGLSERPRASAAARLAARRHRGCESPQHCPQGTPRPREGTGQQSPQAPRCSGPVSPPALLPLPPSHGGHLDEVPTAGEVARTGGDIHSLSLPTASQAAGRQRWEGLQLPCLREHLALPFGAAGCLGA